MSTYFIIIVICVMLILCQWAAEETVSCDRFSKVPESFKFFILVIIAIIALSLMGCFAFIITH